MPEQALKANLEKLRSELANPGSLDDDTRQQLAEVAQTIESLLQAESPDYQQAHASIQDTALRFEASHPAFSRIMSEVTDALAKLGI
jgi:hypothetical protein